VKARFNKPLNSSSSFQICLYGNATIVKSRGLSSGLVSVKL